VPQLGDVAALKLDPLVIVANYSRRLPGHELVQRSA
jgi:hypothetical protein